MTGRRAAGRQRGLDELDLAGPEPDEGPPGLVPSEARRVGPVDHIGRVGRVLHPQAMRRLVFARMSR